MRAHTHTDTQRVRPGLLLEATVDQNVDVSRERAVMVLAQGLAQSYVEHRNSKLSALYLPSSCPISYLYPFPHIGFVSLALALFLFGVYSDPGVECLQQRLPTSQKVSEPRTRAL